MGVGDGSAVEVVLYISFLYLKMNSKVTHVEDTWVADAEVGLGSELLASIELELAL